MPSISTMVYPAPAYVRVETNWADVGQAVAAAVYRVDCLTGERVPLRPYVCFDGDFLDLSCGFGLFWDTEPQLDRCVYYCTQAIDAAGNIATTAADYLSADTFNRTLVDSWGSTETGTTAPQAYVNTGGTVPGNYDVTAGKGTHTNDSVAVFRTSTINVNTPNQGVRADAGIPVTPATSPISVQVIARRTDGNNQYRAILNISTAGVPSLSINRTVGGVGTSLGSATPPGTHSPGDQWTIIIEAWATLIRARAFRTADPDPLTWQLSVTDTALMTGNLAGVQDRLEAGNTNGTVVITWDNFIVYDPCATTKVIESCSSDLVVPSSGDFRFGDPVRPCNDVTLLFTPQIDPDCVPTQGIFFGNMADEVFAANTGDFTPVNSRYPIVANRTRAAISSTLTVASKTFPDRDALRQLNLPGSPLLLRGPADYGIDDRYMSVRDVTEARPVADHKIPPRVVTMPHVEVARPSGPSQGVCGTRVQDLCDIYPTWDALIAAGLTYADLLRGKASNDTPLPDTVERTWSQVNTTYADWNAVNAGNSDWDDLRDGA